MLRRICNEVEKFVSERYGFDERNKYLMRWSFIFVLVASFLKNDFFSGLFYALSIVSLVYVYYCMLSRDIPRRTAENERILYFFYRMRRKKMIAKRCRQLRKKHGYSVNKICGQHVCILAAQENKDSSCAGAIPALSVISNHS